MTVSDCGLALLALARRCGDRLFDPATGLCLIPRDTCWYATSLLFDPVEERAALGRRILSSLVSADGTHTPASMLALLLGFPGVLDRSATDSLRRQVAQELVHAAETEWNNGNVNHPLGAYCTLICGWELEGQRWAVDLGTRRLRQLLRRTGEHRSVSRRQAALSEYNSLTYTPLSLCFLALIAAYAREPEARTAALALEQGLWNEAAMHFHAPSQQFAGPHSRSYHEDSVGGYSALHGVWMAAGMGDLYSNPGLSERFDHPSDLLQNALTAIIPFHVPADARALAWKKPLPYGFRMTTYAESYHENVRRGGVQEPVFDDEVYPGGWSDLTTYLTGEYALGSAATPYVNAGHSDAVSLRIRRNGTIRSMADFRSMFTRGVYNGAVPGARNLCHTTGGEVDASYLYEEGRTFTYQHENRVIACYAPKRSGHLGITRFNVEVIFTAYAPFDDIVINGRSAGALPIRVEGGSKICLRDYRTFILLIPLVPVPAASSLPVEVRRSDEFLIIATSNYDGPQADFPRDEINAWRGGFVMELHTADEFGSWRDFVEYAGSVTVSDECTMHGVRTLWLASGGHRMMCRVDPYREQIVERAWDDVPEIIDHFTVTAGGQTGGPFCPRTLFGAGEEQ